MEIGRPCARLQWPSAQNATLELRKGSQTERSRTEQANKNKRNTESRAKRAPGPVLVGRKTNAVASLGVPPAHKRQQSTTKATMATLVMQFESIRRFETTFDSFESPLSITTTMLLLLLDLPAVKKNQKKIKNDHKTQQSTMLLLLLDLPPVKKIEKNQK